MFALGFITGSVVVALLIYLWGIRYLQDSFDAFEKKIDEVSSSVKDLFHKM